MYLSRVIMISYKIVIIVEVVLDKYTYMDGRRIDSYEAKSLFSGEQNHWALSLVEAECLRRNSITGKGIKVAILDPTTTSIQSDFFFSQSKAPFVHGYPISTIVKALLPDSEVSLFYSGSIEDPNRMFEAFIDAKKWGADVINISGSNHFIPIRKPRDEGYVQNNSPIEDLKAQMERYHRETKLRATQIIGSNLFKRFIQENVKNGPLVVAASGYDDIDVAATFSVFPSAIMVGGVKDRGETCDIPHNGRVDIWAPGVVPQAPSGNNRSSYMEGHSIAAPFVAAGAALLIDKFGKDPSTIRQTLKDLSHDYHGLQVINFKNIVENIIS
jgi:hypothetical protein